MLDILQSVGFQDLPTVIVFRVILYANYLLINRQGTTGIAYFILNYNTIGLALFPLLVNSCKGTVQLSRLVGRYLSRLAGRYLSRLVGRYLSALLA